MTCVTASGTSDVNFGKSVSLSSDGNRIGYVFDQETQVTTPATESIVINSSITPWWSLSAAALVSVAPLIVVAFVVERFLSKGNLSGALK